MLVVEVSINRCNPFRSPETPLVAAAITINEKVTGNERRDTVKEEHNEWARTFAINTAARRARYVPFTPLPAPAVIGLSYQSGKKDTLRQLFREVVEVSRSNNGR